MHVLVTGANGFVGRYLCPLLRQHKMTVTEAVRDPRPGMVAVGSIDAETDWSAALQGVDVVVHLAARVHVLKDAAPDCLAEFRKVNVEGTLHLAQQAGKAGVKRLVFISSIAVHGLTSGRQPFSPADRPMPHDAYGLSKYEAEQGLRQIAQRTGLACTIIRPPLVYGPGVGANFRRLICLVASGIPIPLARVRNIRNPVYVGNLCDLIRVCLEHPAAPGHVFLVSDDCDTSTPDLLRLIGREMNRNVRLFPVPLGLLYAAGRLMGRQGEIARLCESLQVNISDTKKILGWKPPFTMEEGIRRTIHESGCPGPDRLRILH